MATKYEYMSFVELIEDLMNYQQILSKLISKSSNHKLAGT